MKRFVFSVLLSLAATAVTAQPPDAKTAGPAQKAAGPTKQIKFPDVPNLKKVEPKADPDASVAIRPGQYYVIASPKPLLVMPSGTGEVSISSRKPPFMLPASAAIGWAPDAKDTEFVNWGDDYPHLYVVKGVKSGDVTLLIVPALNDTDSAGKQVPLAPKDVLRKSLVVDDGTGPRPPPPGPGPSPVIVVPPAKGFRVLFVYENEANLSREQLNILNSTKITAYLNEKCVKVDGRAEWRKWDKTTIDKSGLANESAIWRQLWTDTKDKLGKLPQIVIVTDQSGSTFEMPLTEDEVLTLLKKYGG